MELQLREKTVLIQGPFSSLTQSLIMNLTQEGADIVLMESEDSSASKFCSQVNDQREVNPKFGRAAWMKADVKTLNSAKEAVSNAARFFGSVDIFIDANVVNKPRGFDADTDTAFVDEAINSQLKVPLLMTQAVLPFLKSKRRGRILYLMNESCLRGDRDDVLSTVARTGLVQFARGFAKQLADGHVTINVLSLGLTEEFVLQRYPEASSIKEAVLKMKEKDPSIKITEPDKVAQIVMFLLGQTGNAISGQMLELR